MGMTDPIADLLSRIRNAQQAQHDIVSAPASKVKKSILEILKHEGFISDFTFEANSHQGLLHIYLKYDADLKPIILGIKYR